MATRRGTFALAFAAAALIGCGSSDEVSKQEEAAFQQSIQMGKEKLDPESVPPEVRDRVKAIMEAQSKPASSGAG